MVRSKEALYLLSHMKDLHGNSRNVSFTKEIMRENFQQYMV
jgi:hypothetical protein